MNFKTSIENRLKEDTHFRERRNKDAGLVRMLIARYPGLMYVVEQRLLSFEALIEMVHDYASMDRAWRKALEENVDLRGQDYDDKDRLELEKMAEMGYNKPKESGPSDAAAPEKQITLL